MEKNVSAIDSNETAALERVLAILRSSRQVSVTGVINRTAERMLAARRHCSTVFIGLDHLFGDPALEIILTVFCAGVSKKRVTVSTVCTDIGRPMTTVIRYVQSFERAKIIQREPDWHDRRRMFLTMTDHGYQVVEKYLVMVGW